MANHVFYHVYIIDNNYKLWLDEQLGRLSSGTMLEDVSVNVSVSFRDDNTYTLLQQQVRDYIMDRYGFCNIVNYSIQPAIKCVNEGVTLNIVHQHAKNNPEDNIMYMHTKSIVKPVTDTIQFPFNNTGPRLYSWRQQMQDVCIGKYTQCIEQLQNHDAVGIRWHQHPHPHFSGNFWWATARWVGSLEEPINVRRYRRWGKFSNEFWIAGHRWKGPGYSDITLGQPKIKRM